MTTIVRHVKLPADSIKVSGVKVKYAPGSKRLADTQALKPAKSMTEMFGADAVTPSVKGRQGITPSTIGIASQKRFAQLANQAMVTKNALDIAYELKLFDVPPELDEAADQVISMCIKTIKKLAALTGEALKNYEASGAVPGTADKGADYPETGANNQSSPTGLDAARPILTAEDAARVERARANLSRLRTAQAFGDPGDIVRARLDLDPRAVDADELYAMFEGKRSK